MSPNAKLANYTTGVAKGSPTITVHSCQGCGRLPKVIQEGPILIFHMFHSRGCKVLAAEVQAAIKARKQPRT